MKTLKSVLLTVWMSLCCLLPGVLSGKTTADPEKIIVAYVTSWSTLLPDPCCMTHINYAFGHVSDSFDGIRIENEERLHTIAGLKKEYPHLKVLLSIGGWGSGRFSEMAADENYRQRFTRECRTVVDIFGLDGIDIDWEYPTSSAADISSSPQDTENFTLLMRDIRTAIGRDKLLTLATVATAQYIDFPAILPYIDFVNTMSYDMSVPPRHHSALYRSELAGRTTSSESIDAHLKAGVPADMLVMGMPFYGRGGKILSSFVDYKKILELNDLNEKWDEVAQVPYLTDREGEMVCCYENPRSLAIKCNYIKEKGLLGGMYWDYAGDNERGDLRKTVSSVLRGTSCCIPDEPLLNVLVLTERGGQHGSFTDAALAWLENKSSEMNFRYTEINRPDPITEEYLKQYDLFIQLDYPPYTWPAVAEKAFVDYIEKGKGGWIGFHHATLLGEFDGYPLWDWFSGFMGGIRFKNYIAETATGRVLVEDMAHPVMRGVPESFLIPDDEWYTFDRSPRPQVKVLANVDESTYQPASAITMGDHPVIWTNERMKARNVYFLFGHTGKLFDTPEFTTLFKNAIRWTTGEID